MSVVCLGFFMEEIVDLDDEFKKIMIFEFEKKVLVQNLGFVVGLFEYIDFLFEFCIEEDEFKLGMNVFKVYVYLLLY